MYKYAVLFRIYDTWQIWMEYQKGEKKPSRTKQATPFSHLQNNFFRSRGILTWVTMFLSFVNQASSRRSPWVLWIMIISEKPYIYMDKSFQDKFYSILGANTLSFNFKHLCFILLPWCIFNKCMHFGFIRNTLFWTNVKLSAHYLIPIMLLNRV